MKIEKLKDKFDLLIEELLNLQIGKPRFTSPASILIPDYAELHEGYYSYVPKFMLDEDHWYADPPVLSTLKTAHGVNMVGTTVDSVHDLASLYKIFRSDSQEVFRIIYINNDEIVGYDYITSKAVGYSSSTLYSKDLKNVEASTDNLKKAYIKSFVHFNTKYERLNATGYYLFHNHPNESSLPSKADLDETKVFKNNLDGRFLGHIIMAPSSYHIIDANLKVSKKFKLEKDFTPRKIYGKISSYRDLIEYSTRALTGEDTSLIVYLTGKKQLTSIIATEVVDNYEFNDSSFYKYIRNNLNRIGASGAYLITTDRNIFYNFNRFLLATSDLTDIILIKNNTYFIRSEWDNAIKDIEGKDFLLKSYKIH